MGGIAVSIALGSLTSGIGALAAGLAFSQILTAALVGGGFGALSFLLNKPKKPKGFSGADHVVTSVREAQPAQQWVLGRRRIGGKICYMGNRANDGGPVNEGWLDIVIVLASHPIEAIEQVYINKERVFIYTSGDDEGDVMSPNDLPRNVENDQDQIKIQKRYQGHAHFEFRLDGVSEPFPDLTNDSGHDWQGEAANSGVAGDKGDGLALAYFKAKWNRNAYPNGEPSLSFVVKGANNVYDPRTDATGFTQNAALLAAYALEEIPRIKRRRINTEQLIAAANVCDMLVDSYNKEGTLIRQKQYRLSALISSEDSVQQVIDEMASSMAGAIFNAPLGGWYIYPGYAGAPSGTWNEEDIVLDSIELKPRIPLDERYNAIHGRHIDTDNDWDFIDTKEVTNSGYIVEDGEKLITTLELPYVIYVGQSVRIQQQYLRRARSEAEITLSLHDPELALEFHQWQVINLNLARFGYTNARFRIVAINDQNANDNQSYQFTLKEDDASSYDFIDGFNDLVLPSYRSSNLVGADYVPVLTGLTILSGEDELKVSKDGTVQSRILVRWDDPQSPYVFDTQIEFKARADDPFQVLYTGLNELYIPNAEDEVEYTIRAAHRNTLGVVGQKFELTHTVEGKSALPDTPISVVFTQVGNQIKAEIQGVESRDLASVIFRGHQLSFGANRNIDQLPRMQNPADWEEATLYGQIVSSARNAGGSLTYYIQLSKTGYYILAARTVDTSGNLSDGIASDTFTYVNQIQSDNLFEIDYAPDFNQGTLNNKLIVANDALMPAGFNLAENETRRGWNKSYAGRVFAGEVDGFTIPRETPTQYNGFQLWGSTFGYAREDGFGNYGFFPGNNPLAGGILGTHLAVVDSGVTHDYRMYEFYTTLGENVDAIYARIRREDTNTIHTEDEERIKNSGFYMLIDNEIRDEIEKSELLVFSEAVLTINNDGADNHILLSWFNKKTGKDMLDEAHRVGGGQIGIHETIYKKTHNITPLPTFTADEITFDEPHSVRIYWAVVLQALPFLVNYQEPDVPDPLRKLPINKMSEYEFEVNYRVTSTSPELTARQTDPPTVDSNGAEMILIGNAQVIQPVLKLKYQVTPTLCRSFYVRVEKDS